MYKFLEADYTIDSLYFDTAGTTRIKHIAWVISDPRKRNLSLT